MARALGFTGLQIGEEVAFSWSVTKPVIILSIFLRSYWPGVWKSILRFLMLPQVATLSVFATLLNINIPKMICGLKINKIKLPCELWLGKKACRLCCVGEWILVAVKCWFSVLSWCSEAQRTTAKWFETFQLLHLSFVNLWSCNCTKDHKRCKLTDWSVGKECKNLNFPFCYSFPAHTVSLVHVNTIVCLILPHWLLFLLLLWCLGFCRSSERSLGACIARVQGYNSSPLHFRGS